MHDGMRMKTMNTFYIPRWETLPVRTPLPGVFDRLFYEYLLCVPSVMGCNFQKESDFYNTF